MTTHKPNHSHSYDAEMTQKKALWLTALVAGSILAVALLTYTLDVPKQADHADLSVKQAMMNYLFGYSLARSGFTPAMATSTPACSGPLVLHEAQGGNLAIFGRSCEVPHTYFCQEFVFGATGPHMTGAVAVTADSIAQDRVSCAQ